MSAFLISVPGKIRFNVHARQNVGRKLLISSTVCHVLEKKVGGGCGSRQDSKVTSVNMILMANGLRRKNGPKFSRYMYLMYY